jgi:bifunctional non-homologous end joining protein LigD
MTRFVYVLFAHTLDWTPPAAPRVRGKGIAPPPCKVPAQRKALKSQCTPASSREEQRNSYLPELPPDCTDAEVRAAGRTVRLTNLDKPFWPELGYTKRHLLEYYIQISDALLPHLKDRAMVMKRYPNGAAGDFFFMKRAPSPRPEWIEICSIEHASGNIIDFPIVRDLASLLWIINLGCIDLNQWYARCDDINRPDYLHFDLDPVPEAGFEKVLETALVVHEALDELKIPNYAKTTGSRGIHVYVPIVRGPLQKEVWTFAKAFARTLAERRPELITAEYKVAKRPSGRVLLDYNQNAWGRTLASVYSVRPRPQATVSTPVTWEEIESGIRTEDFRMENVPARVRQLGDLWKPLVATRGRLRLEQFL